MTHLVVADGYTGVEDIADHDKMSVPLRLAFLHLDSALAVGFVHQRLYLLYLLHCQWLESGELQLMPNRLPASYIGYVQCTCENDHMTTKKLLYRKLRIIRP